MKELLEDPKIIEPLHEIGCACSVCVTERKSRVRSSHPLMDKEIKAQRILIPRSEAIEIARDELNFHQHRIGELMAELERLGDMS